MVTDNAMLKNNADGRIIAKRSKQIRPGLKDC